jgi:hypothetical protein
VTRLALVLLVGFLAASTAGVLDLVLPDPCSVVESGASPIDGRCPPTCIRCHCTSAFDLAFLFELGDGSLLSANWRPFAPAAPQLFSHDILHVPRPSLG